MSIDELAMIVDAILQISIELVRDSTSRRQAVLHILNTVGLKPNSPPSGFDGVYAYTLIEYGIGKPAPALAFFRHDSIQTAFRQSFEKRNTLILKKEAEKVIEWDKVGEDLKQIDVNPRQEFALFTAIFYEIIDRTLTPSMARLSPKVDNVHDDLDEAVSEIVKRFERLNTLDEIRVELEKLGQKYQERQFAFVPSGERLKVFVSSKMTELRDVREIVSNALEQRGIDAWVYEARSGAMPEGVVETSLREAESADIYVGLFWQNFGEVTVLEYRHARTLDKPCFIYIRDKDIQREKMLQDFLQAEVYDPKSGVSYDYFDSAVKLGPQVADDIMSWLVYRHREMTAEIKEARVSREEIGRLKTEVARLQNMSRELLPQGTVVDYLAQHLRAWFITQSFQFEAYEVREDGYFEWIINVPARRGYDRILVHGVQGEAEVSDIFAMKQTIKQQEVDEGWLIAARRVSQAARDEVGKSRDRNLFVYTLDELLDEHADFSGYFSWLETEIKRRCIDTMFVPLAGVKDDFDPITKGRIGTSRYDERNGWIEGYIDRWLDDPSKEHISVLGEFGTGKTWFALHYAWVALQRYKEAKQRGIERPRLPLYIPLRDYAKAISAESLFSEFFFRKHEIPLSGYSAFEQLNRMGKLLLIFDGFDEMAAKVDRQKMINNFWELARVVVPGSKAILTCRTEHFPEATEGRALLSAELQASTANLTGEPPQFEVLELEILDDSQIRQVLASRADSATIGQVMENHQLLDLARRPVMIDFILEALPDIEEGKAVDLPRIYLYAVHHKMERDIKAERTFTSLADKLYFLCELSWEMLSTDRMSLNYRLFPDRLRHLFGQTVEEQKDLDHWHYDMMGQTMLIRNADGDYTPAHRSLLEFFVAYKFAAELGVLLDDFTGLAKQQSHVDPTANPRNYTWSSYFQRGRGEQGEIEQIPPLQIFVPEQMRKLVTTVGAQPLTAALLTMIDGLIDPLRLWRVIQVTQKRSAEEVGYVGGNVATILARKGYHFNILNLERSVLTGADLKHANLNYVNLRGANLASAVLKGATMMYADFREANLANTIIVDAGPQMISWSPNGRYLIGCGNGNIFTAWETDTWRELEIPKTHSGFVETLAWSDDGEWIASGDRNGEIIIWDVDTWNTKTLAPEHRSPITSIGWSHDGKLLATGDTAGSVKIWDIESASVIFALDRIPGHIEALCFNSAGTLLALGFGSLTKLYVWNFEDNLILSRQVGSFRSSKEIHGEQIEAWDLDAIAGLGFPVTLLIDKKNSMSHDAKYLAKVEDQEVRIRRLVLDDTDREEKLVRLGGCLKCTGMLIHGVQGLDDHTHRDLISRGANDSYLGSLSEWREQYLVTEGIVDTDFFYDIKLFEAGKLDISLLELLYRAGARVDSWVIAHLKESYTTFRDKDGVVRKRRAWDEIAKERARVSANYSDLDS